MEAQVAEQQQLPVSNFRRLKATSKKAGVLRILLDRGAKGLSCFEAVDLCRDYVLHSTISELANLDGVEFHRQDEGFIGASGRRVSYTRYSLTPRGADRARELLGDA